MRDLKGIFSALLVSFNEDGTINEKGLRQIIRHNIDKMKVDGLYVGGSTFNVNGVRARQIFELTKAGKLAEALEIQYVTNDLIEGILANGLYLTIKELLKLEGVDAGYCREPMTSKATAEQVAKAKDLKAKFLS